MILVDECRWPFRGRLWCHLVSNESYDELHTFARLIGMPRVAFQGDHYDLHEDHRELALQQGATPVDGRYLVRALTSAGLRRGPSITGRGLFGVLHLVAPVLITERLVIRQWRVDDVMPAAQIESDPTVMQFVGGVRPLEKTKASIDANGVSLAVKGFGDWALECKDTGEFIGVVGLSGTTDLTTRPTIELSARLKASTWGNGFGYEAAAACLRYGHDELDLRVILASTSLTNKRSVRLLEHLGFIGVHDFDHPKWKANDPHRRHKLFEWSTSQAPE